MIDFTTKQLSWLIITSMGVGGSGYLTLNQKVDDIDKKMAVANNSLENNEKQLDKIEKSLQRIEERGYKKDK